MTSIFLIICTTVIFKQLHFIKNRDLGFRQDHIITTYMREDRLVRNFGSFKEEILGIAGVQGVTSSDLLPHMIVNVYDKAEWEGMQEDPSQQVFGIEVSFDFFDFYQIPILLGMDPRPDFSPFQEEQIYINQTAFRMTGWKDPVGKRFKTWRLSGVVQDFHFAPLNVKIRPLLIRVTSNPKHYLSIKIDARNIERTTAALEKIWDKFSPGYPFSFSFLDRRIQRLYISHKKTGRMLAYFTLLAVFIAGLGLFGLSTYMTEQRTKEIGIRKVLGASVSTLITLLGKRFVAWVLLGSILVWPPAYFVMNLWLRNGFFYRTNINWLTFIVVSGMTIGFVLISVGFRTWRAAGADPVKSLRYE
jgi:putative ABC transport system permease protein